MVHSSQNKQVKTKPQLFQSLRLKLLIEVL